MREAEDKIEAGHGPMATSGVANYIPINLERSYISELKKE
jgi:hypothetical protein